MMSNDSELLKSYAKQVEELLKENKQLKEELEKADSITQSCIFEEKEESTINYRECLNKLDLYKSVIDEVREFADNFIETRYYSSLDEYITQFTWNKEKIDLLEILDKAKVGDKE